MTQPLRRIEDQYEILSKIREGGMGEIYKVRHRLLDEVRVVKILRPHHVGDPELTTRFSREARAAIRLRHPNIVQLFDFILDESGVGLMLMEFIEGLDLKALLAGPRQISVALAVEMARQALGALGYLHRHGFVHRDVSPDNIMLTRDFDDRPLVKLIDLGIAKKLDSQRPQLTASGAFLGKFRYASPEHFGAAGLASVDQRSDLYSFGLVLYELLTGQFPFASGSTSQMIAAHLYGSPVDFSTSDPQERIPPALRELVLKSLRKDPLERFASAGELIEHLDQLEGLPVSDLTVEAREVTLASAPTPDGPTSDHPEQVAEAAAQPDHQPSAKTKDPPAAEDQETLEASSADLPKPPVPEATSEPEAELSNPDTPTTGEELDESGADTSSAVVVSFQALVEGARLALRQGDFAVTEELLEEADLQQEEARSHRKTLAALRRQLEDRRSQIATGGTEAVATITSLLERRELLQADRALFQATERFGATPALDDLRRRLDQLHHEELEADLQRLCEEAESLASRDEAARALDLINKARAVSPVGPWTRRLEELSRTLAERGTEQRQALIADTRLRLIERIDALDYPGAREVLTKAEARLGPDSNSQSLKNFLVEIYLEGIHQRVRQAAAAFGIGNYEDAVALLRQALRLNPDNTWVRDRLEDARQRLDLQQREAPAEVELAADLSAIEDAASRGDLVTARDLLQEAEKRWQTSSRLRPLRKSLDAQIAEELEELLVRAGAARDKHDFLKARLLVARALELDQENADALALIDSLDNAQEATSSAASDLAPSIAEIHQSIARGENLEAWKSVRIAIEHFGDLEILSSLQRQIAERLLSDET